MSKTTNIVKSVLYWSSCVLPVFDFIRGLVNAYDAGLFSKEYNRAREERLKASLEAYIKSEKERFYDDLNINDIEKD